MLKLVILLGVLCVALSDDAEDTKVLSDANTDFAWRFYKAVAAETDNIVFSPLSISKALAMTSSGGEGNTLDEMYQALGYADIEESDILDMSMKLLKVLNADGNEYNMSVANKLYGEQTFKFNQDFLTTLRDKFDSFLEKVDFMKNSEGARQTINSWVEEKTKDKIKELLAQGAVTQDTVLYIVNAIYFGARWLNEFEERWNMENEDFHVSNSETKKVTYMTRHGKRHNYPYAELSELDAKLLELPYNDPKVSMYVLLPNAVDGLQNLESNLEASHLSNSNTENIFSKLDWLGKVSVKLPKFEMTLPIQPKKILADMGMVEAFTEGADFSRIADDPLQITDVVHKAFINVHEGGTEAAAATGIGISLASFDPSQPKEFYADHPFIYFIREKKTGSILFLGRYVAPPGEGGELPRVGELNYQVSDEASLTFGSLLLCTIAAMIASML